jgi:hypothetical protein
MPLDGTPMPPDTSAFPIYLLPVNFLKFEEIAVRRPLLRLRNCC